jgi:hypothetical protein
MDNFSEDTNPFHTEVDEISTVTDDSNVDLGSSLTFPHEQEPQLVEPPELPSKRAYPDPRPRAQSTGFKTELDRYLHSGEDVEIYVCLAHCVGRRCTFLTSPTFFMIF